MTGQPIDWRRAKHPKYVETPSAEISYRAALEDQQILEEIAAQKRKQKTTAYKKLPRTLDKRRALARIERALSRPDRADELRLNAILGGQQLSAYKFERETYFPLTDRAFVCQALRTRVVIDVKSQGKSILLRPGRRKNFTDVILTVGSGSVMHEGSLLAVLLKEVCLEQERLRTGQPDHA